MILEFRLPGVLNSLYIGHSKTQNEGIAGQRRECWIGQETTKNQRHTIN